MVCTGNRSSFIARIRAKPPKQTQEKTSKNAVRAAVKTKKPAEGNATMISVDGDMVISPKARAGWEWFCASKWRVVRLPGRSAWKRIQRRPGLKDLTKP